MTHLFQSLVFGAPEPSRSPALLRSIRCHASSPYPGHCDRSGPISEARVQMASEEKGPNENRVQAEGVQVYWRAGQISHVSKSRVLVLLEATSIRLFSPSHRHGLHLHGGLRKVSLLHARITQKNQNLSRTNDEEKSGHFNGFEVHCHLSVSKKMLLTCY